MQDNVIQNMMLSKVTQILLSLLSSETEHFDKYMNKKGPEVSMGI